MRYDDGYAGLTVIVLMMLVIHMQVMHEEKYGRTEGEYNAVKGRDLQFLRHRYIPTYPAVITEVLTS